QKQAPARRRMKREQALAKGCIQPEFWQVGYAAVRRRSGIAGSRWAAWVIRVDGNERLYPGSGTSLPGCRPVEWLSPTQWATAPLRPRPVWLRTVRASKASRSRSARAVRSVIEKNQIAMNASGMETIPGLGKGMIGSA